MKQKPRTVCSCHSESGVFPVIATVFGVASCFAEPILQKYFALGSSVEVALALMQAVQFALVVRYVAARLNSPNAATTEGSLH